MKSTNATYTGFEFEVDGYPALAIINSDLKKMENKAQYPYSVFIQIVPETFNENGHPEAEEYDYLNEVEKKIIEYLEEQTQTVHVGHTTVYRGRTGRRLKTSWIFIYSILKEKAVSKLNTMKTGIMFQHFMNYYEQNRKLV